METERVIHRHKLISRQVDLFSTVFNPGASKHPLRRLRHETGGEFRQFAVAGSAAVILEHRELLAVPAPGFIGTEARTDLEDLLHAVRQQHLHGELRTRSQEILFRPHRFDVLFRSRGMDFHGSFDLQITGPVKTIPDRPEQFRAQPEIAHLSVIHIHSPGRSRGGRSAFLPFPPPRRSYFSSSIWAVQMLQ